MPPSFIPLLTHCTDPWKVPTAHDTWETPFQAQPQLTSSGSAAPPGPTLRSCQTLAFPDDAVRSQAFLLLPMLFPVPHLSQPHSKELPCSVEAPCPLEAFSDSVEPGTPSHLPRCSHLTLPRRQLKGLPGLPYVDTRGQWSADKRGRTAT